MMLSDQNCSNRISMLFGVLAFLLVATGAAATTVNSFAPFTTTPTPKEWFEVDIADGGTASIVSLSGAGGTLQANQPLPIGAALLTTTAVGTSKAEVGVVDAFAAPSAIFTDASLSIGYDYYKSSTGDGDAAAAPSLKITLFNPVCTQSADCFGTLVYEPTWNQLGFEGSSVNVPTDDWNAVSIAADTGLFWWTGGFGEPSGAGGPPLNTLEDWVAAFDSDFAGAQVSLLSMGVGTNNPAQTGYFDDVTISYTGYSEFYDFEPIPEPSTAALCLVGLLGLGWQGRNRRS